MGFQKIMVEIQGNLFDLWHLVSAEKDQDWNDKQNRLDYLIVLNKTVVSRDFREIILRYDNMEERDNELVNIRKMLSQSPFIIFANDIQEDEELSITKKKKKQQKFSDDIDFDDEEDI